MSKTNAERRQDMSSSPIQRHSQQAQQQPARPPLLNSPAHGKENCVERRFLKNNNTTDAAKSPMKGPLSYKKCLSPRSQKRRRSDNSSVLFAAPMMMSQQDDDFFHRREEERRRQCSDPVAAFLNRQSLVVDDDHCENLPLQASWSNNWQETTSGDHPMRPKPIRPAAIFP
mmetsp:Transcript_44203/g.106506  ORF Transcript_44203/g.106506 Transcript_44203/m.106506 type:complete len:171 (+) Transcript_44203:317-829(+)